ncbi:hypothetical protein TRIATDRAFT_268769 [Trichoderma atroviride IMI 206040]|uniref:Uncharacterized protein n=1 Tax=Hypocrea atroviridis (strain ATCC 20476 / IMI 206040) TaxID=452589 RepID=G9P9F1_HYPAI|nr:uncharacterized protein TRIATDRAFT_268769 [Trichoderma atroviride IMI 206040]EHK40278.1 hypothetical protein TRIATDRAFT_268769 [Trichoderma atroviride IMI 206040]
MTESNGGGQSRLFRPRRISCTPITAPRRQRVVAPTANACWCWSLAHKQRSLGYAAMM